ncbi:MAG: tRNA dihydrouridine(20/20a) synthase DusA [Hyphomicrobiaceae bacterium]
MQNQSHRFCVAPMMDWTDRHCRVFHRQMTRHAMLYTEMVTAEAILHGDRGRLLGFDDVEHPVALQLGGAEPKKLADAARIGEDFGYDEINLNVGCPSDRVKGGNFGACLMADPVLVARAIEAMRAAVNIRVTVKCRIGIDDQDSETDFANFIETVSSAGCDLFIVHARKAWLQGLSPKQNREVPPLDYDRVYRLKTARPDLTVILNGGIATLEQGLGHLAHVDGVMLGRAAYQTPWLLSSVDAEFFDDVSMSPDRDAVLAAMARYAEAHTARGGRLNNVARHMLGLFHGEPGGRLFRRHISERVSVGNNATGEVLREAGRIVAETREAMRRRREMLASVG